MLDAPMNDCTRNGFLRWLADRMKTHRAREEASATSDRANEAAVRAEECAEIVKALAEYWGVE